MHVRLSDCLTGSEGAQACLCWCTGEGAERGAVQSNFGSVPDAEQRYVRPALLPQPLPSSWSPAPSTLLPAHLVPGLKKPFQSCNLLCFCNHCAR